MKFYYEGKELSPCIVSKAKHAMALPNDHKGNGKSLSEDYWRKTVKTVGEFYNADASIIEGAIGRYKDYNP